MNGNIDYIILYYIYCKGLIMRREIIPLRIGKAFIAIVLLCVCMLSTGFAQDPTTTLRITGTRLSAPNTIEFSVYLKNTSQSAFEYASGSYFFNLRPAVLNGGTGTLSILASSLPSNVQPVNPTVTLANDTLQLRLAANLPPGAGSGYTINSGDSVLIVKLALSTSAAFLAYDNKPLYWRNHLNAGNPTTKVSVYINSTFTTITSWCTFIRDLGAWSAITKQVSADWNMLSSPYFRDSMDVSIVFPGSVNPVYGYDNGYAQKFTAEKGAGYWARFSNPASITLSGYIMPLFAVALKAGWNLIGSNSDAIPTSAISTHPAGSINSQFYGFNGSYYTASTINPGNAYWVRASQRCLMFVSQKVK